MTTAATPSEQLKTRLYDFHVARGGHMVDFAGWTMPLRYGSIIDEHRQVRTSGGLFDVSHMGRFRFTGKDARRFLDHVCTRQIHGMANGQARYSLVCNESGGCKDDVLVYKLDDGEYMMVCNASNREKLIEHFKAVKGDMTFRFEDETFTTAMLALQGPKVMELIEAYSSEIPALKRFRFAQKSVGGLKLLVSRTGYTGEDGVEVIFSTKGLIAGTALKLFQSKFEQLEPRVQLIGLAARDSLRLEAAMALYGHEITETIDPLSAGLDFAVKLNKGDGSESSPTEAGRFIGQTALERIASEGPARRLVGLVLDTRRSARQGMPVLDGETPIGEITSGCLSPTLEKSIAMAYVPSAMAGQGTAFRVDLGRQQVDASVTPTPFI